MPELPEVHTIATDLNTYLKNYIISKVIIYGNYKALPNNPTFIKYATGSKIIGASRVAKNILLELDSGNFILIHLAMTGRVLLRDFNDKSDGWVRVSFQLEKDKEKKTLNFTDIRMFGKIAVINKKLLEQLKEKYGPDLYLQDLSISEFSEKIKSKKSNIKNVLLDQKIVSGLGNIYATDALFLAKINPSTPTSKLTLEEASKLLKAVKEVLTEGILNRGSTLPDKAYLDIFGKEGKQQEYFKIYMKTSCPVCRSKVEFTKINGRGTYYCPNCQK